MAANSTADDIAEATKKSRSLLWRIFWSPFRAFKWLSDKIGYIPTAGGLVLLPFIGAVANRAQILNPDIDRLDAALSFYHPLNTDPNSVLVSSEGTMSASELATGPEGWVEGAQGVIDGWTFLLGPAVESTGNVLGQAWDSVVTETAGAATSQAANTATTEFTTQVAYTATEEIATNLAVDAIAASLTPIADVVFPGASLLISASMHALPIPGAEALELVA